MSKAISFVIGAVGTFLVNIPRIVTIFKLVADVGKEAGNMFHSYYGELFFIAWMITYLMILLLLSRRIRPRLPIGAEPSETG